MEVVARLYAKSSTWRHYDGRFSEDAWVIGDECDDSAPQTTWSFGQWRFELTPVRMERDWGFFHIGRFLDEGTFEGDALRVSSLDGSWAPPSTGFAYKKCCFETADRPPVLAEGNRTTVDSWVTNPRDYNTSTTAMSVLALFHHLPNMICNECRRYLAACRKALDISATGVAKWLVEINGST